MKTLKTVLPMACMLLLPMAALATPIAYPFRVTDNSGVLVAGATVAIGATTLTAGSAATVPAAAGEKLLTTNAAPGSTVSVTLLDYGTGDDAIIYDPAIYGEMYFPVSVSKAGSTITGASALIAVVCALDSSAVLASLAASTANGSAIANVPGLILTTPANKIATSASGAVTLAPAQAYTNSTPGTVPPVWYTDPLSAVVLTVPGAGTTTGQPQTLTIRQLQSLTASLAGGNSTATAPVAGGTATVTYYLLGQPKAAGNVVAVSTPTFDANRAVTGRVVLVAQPFPAVQ